MILGVLYDALTSLLAFLASNALLHHLLRHFCIAALVVLVLAAALTARIVLLLPPIRTKLGLRVQGSIQRDAGETCKTALFLGSGGHTTELLLLLSHLDPQRYTPRIYFISSNDDFSKSKVEELERSWGQNLHNFSITTLPRARNIHQSWVTTPWTVLKSFAAAYSSTCPSHDLNGREEPFADLLLMNGPGTCVPLLLATYLHQLLPLWPSFHLFRSSSSLPLRPRSIYIESFARVKTLSLTGKIVQWGVDRFVKQWRSQQERAALDGSTAKAETLSRHWLV